MYISEGVTMMIDEVKTVRRELHTIPEIGMHEYKTSEYICIFLEKLGINYEKNIVNTGIVASFISSKSNYTIAFRSDMDALSLVENCDIDFKSLHDGYMHGCGHDGHMTMLLMFAKYLSENKNDLNYNVVLIFQPAEEGPGGALPMIKAGVLKKYNVDEIFGIHLHPEFEEGVLAINSGPIMAQTGEFDIDIFSKSGHGAMPHTAVDGIIIASAFINQMQTIISRNINPTEAGVVTVGKITGGERRNIIAEHVRLEGTSRAFTEDTYEIIKMRIFQIAKGLEVIYDCNINVEFRDMYPPVVNDKKAVEHFIAANESLTIVEFPPQMIAEDFSYYLKEIPGAFVFVGTKNIEKQYIYPLHNSKFNFDEVALLTGIQSYINIINYKGKLL